MATDSTYKYIRDIGIKCQSVSSLTKFQEILNGRVKTLNPNIHASLLYKRSNKKHLKEFNSISFPSIDFLIVNLYPFEKIIKLNKSEQDCIEMIDIGGPALLRSAAKNFNYVTAVPNITYYKRFIKNLNDNNGKTTLNFRKKMSEKVFRTTYLYDFSVNNWLKNHSKKSISLDGHKEDILRYGENPNQKATVIYNKQEQNIFNNIVQGKKPSYNNILDIDSALNCLNEFSETACVIIKHNNPCGVALAKNSREAFKKAFESDKQSAFGGIVGFNKKIDGSVARILKKNFFEIIIAKGFDKKAKKIFQEKNNLIIIDSSKIKIDKSNEFKSINNGYLKQEKNLARINIGNVKCMSDLKATKNQLEDLIFAFKVCKHVKSNAIVLAKNTQTVGIGAGQMSRIDSTKIAISKHNNKNGGFVAASDAFFPFNDNVNILLKNKCKSIIQPSGSINDKNIIKLANEKKISVYFTKYRVFKH